MKNTFASITVILLLFFGFSVGAQPLEVRLDMENDTISEYEFTGIGENQIYLRMPYAGYTINNPGSIKALKGKFVEKIELIYTAYPEGKDMRKLNKQRIVSLYLLKPELFDNHLTDWRLVTQTKCKTQREAWNMFHGFSITYTPRPTKEFSSYESGYLKDAYEGKEELKDSTVLKIMERNKEWDKMVVIADLTGSMSPYAAQLVVWFKLTLKNQRAKFFVFFNDGDKMPDDEKEIGKTGGIYDIEGDKPSDVLDRMLETMENGYGGDLPENNLEATLFAINKFDEKKYREIVMIADNKATPRDVELVEKIDKPIHIVLCGTDKGVNPVYLDIARATKGTVHTIEEDIKDLVELNEGETITIAGQSFIIKDGHFELVKRL